MKIDPQTAVGSLLVAVPSAAIVFERFGIQVDENEKKTLQAVCTEHDIAMKEFLHAMDEIDWNGESPEKREA
jgi:hypothetical protein